MKVDVYRNLNRKCFSIRSREKENYGRVIGHANTVAVRDASFIVQPAGREKVVRTGVKNVHAFVRGDLVTDMSPESAWRSSPGSELDVSYRPAMGARFLAQNNTTAMIANTAAICLMTDGKNVKAKRVNGTE
jgi:hypothetical protein